MNLTLSIIFEADVVPCVVMESVIESELHTTTVFSFRPQLTEMISEGVVVPYEHLDKFLDIVSQCYLLIYPKLFGYLQMVWILKKV